MDFIKSLFGYVSGASNALIYIIIIIMFVIGVIFCVTPVLRTRKRLRAAIRVLKQGNRAKRNWDEDDFLGKGTLMPHWSAYLNNLFFADGKFHNPSNVEDFINEETAIYGPGRSSFADAVPSLLVSLGFLGTLLGLSSGLAGFNMTDAAAAQNSITVLIPGMKYAFMTSIFGVIGSVLFTLITRAVYGSTEATLRDFYGALSKYAKVLSVDPLTQVAIYQQEQTALIQTIAKDLNGTFTENITRAIRDSSVPLQNELKNFMNVASRDQMRFLDAVVNRFVDRMDEISGDKIRAFGQTLDRLARQQEEGFAALSAGMTESEAAVRDLRNIQRISSELADAMDRCIGDIRNTQKQSDDVFKHISGTVDTMDQVSRRQNDYLRTLNSMQIEMNRSLDTMTGAVTAFSRQFTEQTATNSAALKDAAGALQATADDLRDVHIAAAQALDREFKSTLDHYQNYVNEFTLRVDYLAKSIGDALAALPNSVDETSDRFLDQIDRMTATLNEAQRALNSAVDRLYGRN
ncbi:MAG: MotA/TolQ/ExbB proton channel family protein [Clostridia bacterium]|nr:MotA/TolQ/ExbB proton channel family protein [Clostridia bacterium]